MSPVKGRRKRKENFDHESNGNEEKRLKQCSVNGEVNNTEIDTLDSVQNESPEMKRKTLETFHAKFTKSVNENGAENICKIGKHICFACKIKDFDLVRCSVKSCDKFYHNKCLEKLPSVKTEQNTCPLHLCLTCYNVNPKNPQVSKGQMYKCFKCPTAYHAKDECGIPGSVILTHDIMSCPDHFSPEQQREYPAIMNMTFCVHCGCNENLIFCNFCPTAMHKECIQGGTFIDNNFFCERCESRKIICYDDVVWAKICNFRWWPAKVLNPKAIPVEVQKMKHFEGEFPVKFFETNDYFWTQKGRVYPFVFRQVGIEDNRKKHNFKKQAPDPVFNNAITAAFKAIKDKKTLQSSESSNGLKPPPYKHIKNNRPVGTVQIYTFNDSADYTTCGCQADDPHPCGYDTLCLNRNMCTECLPDVCEAGDRCENQLFQKHKYAAVKPFLTESRGWGLKAMEDIKGGHFVIEYIGDLIDEEECNRRIEEKQACGDTNFYFCTLDATRIIDAGPKGNFSRFLNHSCDPNCETQKWSVNGDSRVGIFAKKDIPAGTELTFDYRMDFSHHKKLKCNCGAERCSGLIGKKPQLIPVVSKIQELNGNIKTNTKVESIGDKKNKRVCFKCKKGGKQILCTRDKCNKSFHIRCLGANTDLKISASKWECPCHFCKKCKNEKTESVYQCYACPNAYCDEHAGFVKKSKHVSDTNNNMACPKHQ
ncbi:histone-lysine N-methyltransferase NSD2-like [Stegodyphus dumicola]|uniref:histone-lysine N-methyltransferase NSD2-like n=1 Tax=Stegodyphus dumicola TaxID=202533 RepID=UPI0015B2B3F9|nr:histone-lysine N-methyltransferase NSD2-like [Stegodyphus dumicola]XP_035232884.1 histone-lysine N-methyltransferase NSD2-like [Stegodyphus dumicola]